MPVPLLDLSRQNTPLHADLLAAFERVLGSGHFIQGPEVEQFESEVARFLGVRHAVAVSSGTDAILVALMALRIGPGDEVICPSFTFFATAGCIARTGATPVFADSDPQSFNIDPLDLPRRITPRTKAIIPVHLFGQSADMDAVLAISRKHGLAVIEDAAQALGARYKGQPCGGLGDAGTFSFFPSKNLGGFGDGGLVATNRDDLAAQVRLLRTHGAKPKYFHQVVGGNFRLDALQCALLRVKLPHLPAFCNARRSHAAVYHEKLSPLVESGHLVVPKTIEGCDHIWNQYTLRVPGVGQRDALKEHLARQGIGCEIYYPLPMHQQQCFSNLKHDKLPVAEMLAREAISIPVFPELTAAERQQVVDTIATWAQAPAGSHAQ